MARKAFRKAATCCGVADKRKFFSQEEFDQLPIAPWFDLLGRVIPNHPQLPAHLRNIKPDPKNAVPRVVRRRKRPQAAEKRERGYERLHLRHKCLHCKHTKTFFHNISRTGMTSLRTLDRFTHEANVPSRVT